METGYEQYERDLLGADLKLLHIWIVEKKDIDNLNVIYPSPHVDPQIGDIIFVKRKG